MTSTGEQIVNRFVTTLNERDFDGFEALFVEDYQQHQALATNTGVPAARHAVRTYYEDRSHRRTAGHQHREHQRALGPASPDQRPADGPVDATPHQPLPRARRNPVLRLGLRPRLEHGPLAGGSGRVDHRLGPSRRGLPEPAQLTCRFRVLVDVLRGAGEHQRIDLEGCDGGGGARSR
jgi:hypothetical protein